MKANEGIKNFNLHLHLIPYKVKLPRLISQVTATRSLSQDGVFWAIKKYGKLTGRNMTSGSCADKGSKNNQKKQGGVNAKCNINVTTLFTTITSTTAATKTLTIILPLSPTVGSRTTLYRLIENCLPQRSINSPDPHPLIGRQYNFREARL